MNKISLILEEKIRDLKYKLNVYKQKRKSNCFWKKITKRIKRQDVFSSALHEIWSNWYIYQKNNSTPENIARWDIQSKCSYEELSETDKDKDREIYRKYFKDLR